MTGDDLSTLTGVPKSTLANKAKLIRDLLRIGQLDPKLCRRELLAYALQVETLDEVTHAAWRDASDLKKVVAKRPPYNIRAE